MMHHVRGPHWRTRLYLADEPRFADGTLPELYLARMGRFESDGRFRHQQVPASVSVHVVADGSGQMIADGRAFEVRAGDVFVFFPQQHIRYFDHRATPWRYTWFTLRGSRAETVLADCGFDRKHPHRPAGRTPGIETAFRAAEEELGQLTVSSPTVIALSWRLVRELEPTPARQAPPSLAAQALILFDHHYGGQLSVDEIAGKLNVSRSTLFRAFQDEHGRSPKEMLDELRMLKAMHLLKASKESVKEIAAACGYAGEAYFSRVFKTRTGLPPSTWRLHQPPLTDSPATDSQPVACPITKATKCSLRNQPGDKS